MKPMKYFTLAILSTLALAGCKKDQNAAPTSTKTNYTNVGAQTDDNIANQPNAIQNFSDTGTYRVAFYVPPQRVRVGVSGDTLLMYFRERVFLILNPKAYDQSWAVHLFDNFSCATLGDFDFTSKPSKKDVVFDWIDNNLNNVKPKKVVDTTLLGQPIVRILVHRVFNFSKVYSSNAEAVAEENKLLATTTDVMNFSSYIYFVDGNHPTYKATGRIIYEPRPVTTP